MIAFPIFSTLKKRTHSPQEYVSPYAGAASAPGRWKVPTVSSRAGAVPARRYQASTASSPAMNRKQNGN
jgi:hypothetical protein